MACQAPSQIVLNAKSFTSLYHTYSNHPPLKRFRIFAADTYNTVLLYPPLSRLQSKVNC